MGRRQRRRTKIKQGFPSAVSPATISAHSPAKTSSSSSSGLSSDRVAQRKTAAAAASSSSSSSCSSKLQEEEEEAEVEAKGQLRSTHSKRGADPRALKLRLLNLIRTFYLQALSRLPTADLWARHARGVLVAGQCYGPLAPVDNILVSAIWYDAAFPLRPLLPTNTFFQVSSTSIARLAHRSLQGLLACLRHSCPSLSMDDALWHLHLARADLAAAITSAGQTSPPTHDAFLAAAQAAHHPVPPAMALFASSILPKVQNDVGDILHNSCLLSVPDIDRLSIMLVPLPLPKDLSPSPPVVSPRVAKIIRYSMETSKKCQETSRRMVEVALRKYAHQTGQHYDLHFICASNMVINRLDMYYHINFLARSKEHVDLPAVLFFVEVSPDDDDDDKDDEDEDDDDDDVDYDVREEHITLCCPLTPSRAGGCRACVQSCKVIDHPIGKEHRGGLDYNDDDGKVGVDRDYRGPLHMDYIFFDAERDRATVSWIAERDDDDDTNLGHVREL